MILVQTKDNTVIIGDDIVACVTGPYQSHGTVTLRGESDQRPWKAACDQATALRALQRAISAAGKHAVSFTSQAL